MFEEEFNISEIIKYKYEYLCFKDCKFYFKADFSKFTFEKDLEFRNCVFYKDVYFGESIFNCNFKAIGNSFQCTKEKVFNNCKFNGEFIYIEENREFPRLEGALLRDCKLVFKNCQYKLENCEVARINYTISRKQAEKINDTNNIGYYTYYERKYLSDLENQKDYSNYSEYVLVRVLNYISKVFVGYGEHISRLFFTMIFVISIFAFLYMNLGVNTCFGDSLKIGIGDFSRYSILDFFLLYVRFWYFSFMTFSTVGFGDMIVNTILGQILVCVEVFIGVIIQSTWVALIIKKMFK